MSELWRALERNLCGFLWCELFFFSLSSLLFKRLAKQNAFLFKKVLQWVVRCTLSKPSRGTTPTN